MKHTTIIITIASLLLSGCNDKYWRLKYTPTTGDERKAVCEHAEKILAVTPRELAGHDQDWDDAIQAAHLTAREAICRPTLWEFDGYLETGRWKYIEEAGK